MIGKAVTAWAAACLLGAGLASSGAFAAGDADLVSAREELRLRTETERRMREEFETLLAGGRMSASEITDFEDYLHRLGTMVDEQRRTVARLEGSGDAAESASFPDDFNRGQTDAEKVALLDAELGGSLSEFDEKLLREQQEISEKSRAASTGDGGEASEGGDGASGSSGEGQGGEGQGEGESESEQASSGGQPPAGGEGQGAESEQGDASQEEGQDGGERAEGDDQMASAGGASQPGSRSGTTSTPPDIPDGKDDDIVARQLREAAENEQDPELREKLWDEYRKYKARTP